ncbi:lamin tail domain-containing protein [bacterium]|nr:lamin tail domain-containing protein [bacterium]
MKKLTIIFIAALLLTSMQIVEAATPGDVVINEIAWAGTSGSTSDEWIELYNTTDAPIDIAAWSIYGADTGVVLNISAADGNNTTIIPAKGYLIYANDAVVFTSGATIEIWDATIGMNVGGDSIILYDGQDGTGNVIDTADDNSGVWCAGVAAGFYSMERIDPCSPGDVCSNWATNDGITINGEPSINGTPGQPNSVEVSTCGGAAADTTPPTITATAPVNGASAVNPIQDITIDFDEEMADTSTLGIIISPSPGGEGYTWSNTTQTLTITHNTLSFGTTYYIEIDKTVVADVAGNTLADSASVDDSGGDTYTFNFQTSQYGDGTGTAVAYPSNILKDNHQSVNVIYTASLDMAGGQVSLYIPANWSQPQDGAPASEGYLSLSGDAVASIASITGNETTGWEIIADITTLDTGNTLIFIYGDMSLGSPGAMCDTLGTYAFTVRSKGTGTLSAIGASPSIEVYESMTGKVVVNEVAFGGTLHSSSDEWIELYNPTGEGIDLTGWYVQGVGFILETLSGTIPAFGYYLIENSEDTVNDVAGGFVDTSLSLSNTGATITLKNSSDVTVDLVDCGAGWFGGTGSPAYYSMERIDPCVGGSVAGNWGSNDGITINGLDADNNPLNATPGAENSNYSTSCGDYASPTVLYTSPIDSGVNIDTATDIVITFSEEMNTVSVDLSLEIIPAVAYTLSWDAGNETLTMTLTAPLSEDTSYDITVYSGAMDISGNGLDGDDDGAPGGDYLFSFNTIDNRPPSVINDFAAYSHPTIGGIRINFTAVGENGLGVSQCDSYEIAYSTAPITDDADFIASDKYDTSGITPLLPAQAEEHILTMLPAGTTYYISVKALDESGNSSPFGNVDSAVSGSYGISKTPNVPLCQGGNGDLGIDYTVGYPKLDGDDDLYIVVHSSFTQPTLANLTVTVDASNTVAYTVSGSTITIAGITAASSVSIDFNSYNFPDAEGVYEFGISILENGTDLVELNSPEFDVLSPAVMTFDPAEDPHTAPGKDREILVYITSDTGLGLYGADVATSLIDTPLGASIAPSSALTGTDGSASFTLTLSTEAGKHIVEFTCVDLLEYFIDTSFDGNNIYTPYPNPATPDVDTITFEINILEESNVTLTILTLDARKVVEIHDAVLSAGFHQITWDLKDRYGRKIPAGIYFGLVKADSFTAMVKFSVVR